MLLYFNTIFKIKNYKCCTGELRYNYFLHTDKYQTFKTFKDLNLFSKPGTKATFFF